MGIGLPWTRTSLDTASDALVLQEHRTVSDDRSVCVPRFKRAAVIACVIALLGMMALLAGGAARRESVTVDEVAHVGAGVSYLQKLDLRMNEEHPPLPKL
jgi:uncharacterized membrane protein YidH (DUF202 family)